LWRGRVWACAFHWVYDQVRVLGEGVVCSHEPGCAGFFLHERMLCFLHTQDISMYVLICVVLCVYL
jgi:hypothetical protein